MTFVKWDSHHLPPRAPMDTHEAIIYRGSDGVTRWWEPEFAFAFRRGYRYDQIYIWR